MVLCHTSQRGLGHPYSKLLPPFKVPVRRTKLFSLHLLVESRLRSRVNRDGMGSSFVVVESKGGTAPVRRPDRLDHASSCLPATVKFGEIRGEKFDEFGPRPPRPRTPAALDSNGSLFTSLSPPNLQ